MRHSLESRFGHDFSRVRIHTDPEAAASARALHARAYTVGHDIVFAAGAYRPHSAAGRWLLAHELAHVVQQGAATSRGEAAPTAKAPPAAEREARAAANAVAAGAPAAVTQRVAAPVVQKQDAGAEEPAPLQVPAARWSPRELSITLRSSRARAHDGGTGSGCSGLAAPGIQQAFSACGRVEDFCATPARYPFRFWFHVDTQGLPRPQPFRPPAVELAWQFVDERGAAQSGHERDTAPAYNGDGQPLAPSFGQFLTVSAPSSGQLWLTLALADPDSGVGVTYRDQIQCRLVPCG
jgi:hypothetical protein